MSFKPSPPSSPTTESDIPTFDNVAYSDIVEGSVYYEEEVSTIMIPVQIHFSDFLNFIDGNRTYYISQ
jgi:hypothetical protein